MGASQNRRKLNLVVWIPYDALLESQQNWRCRFAASGFMVCTCRASFDTSVPATLIRRLNVWNSSVYIDVFLLLKAPPCLLNYTILYTLDAHAFGLLHPAASPLWLKFHDADTVPSIVPIPWIFGCDCSVRSPMWLVLYFSVLSNQRISTVYTPIEYILAIVSISSLTPVIVPVPSMP